MNRARERDCDRSLGIVRGIGTFAYTLRLPLECDALPVILRPYAEYCSQACDPPIDMISHNRSGDPQLLDVLICDHDRLMRVTVHDLHRIAQRFVIER